MNKLLKQLNISSNYHGLVLKLMSQDYIEKMEYDSKVRMLIGFVNDIISLK